MKKVLFATVTLMLGLTMVPNASHAHGQRSALCYQNEITLFSCSTVHRNQLKTVSVCSDRYQMNVSYRFGVSSQTELNITLYDTTRGAESQAAKRDYYSNGEQLSIEFANGDYSYTVWSTDRDEHGVSISRAGSVIGNLSCTDVSKGLDADQLKNQFPNSDSL